MLKNGYTIVLIRMYFYTFCIIAHKVLKTNTKTNNIEFQHAYTKKFSKQWLLNSLFSCTRNEKNDKIIIKANV